MAVTFWQLFIGFLAVAVCAPAFEGTPHFWPLRIETLLAVAFSGLVGSGIAFFLWFDIVRRVPAMTASLGVLSVPPVGVLGAVVLLGERPTLTDITGFALILLASACVLVAPGLGRRRSARAD
jgi:drug/metabolite transporter (DMT)-like permease